MKKILLTTIVAYLALTLNLYAQNIKYSEMLMASQNYSWGTARSMAMAGSFGSLGGDMASLSLNPAGLGVYRSSEFSFTPSLNYNNSISNFGNRTDEDFSQKLNIGNIGCVWNYNSGRDIGWVSASLGMAYNRLNDFNRNVTMRNNYATSSLLDEFAYYANGGDGISPDNLSGPSIPEKLYQYYEGLAFDTYALDNYLFGDWYHSQYSYTHAYGQVQERQIKTKGGIGEYDFSFGANYSNQFYIGATIGIQHLKYNSEMRHTEDDVRDSTVDLSYFDFYEYQNIEGLGYNLKFGVIYKPIDFLRLGLAIHTPTFYSLESDFSTYMYTQFDNNIIPNGSGGYTNYSYKTSDTRYANNKLVTPWKFIGSLGFQFAQFGVINVDYEHLDYTKMRLSGDDVNNQVQDVKDKLQAVNNLRIGAEFKLDDIAFRGGYSYNQTSYSEKDIQYIDYQTYSAGIGYRGKSFSIDFAYLLLSYPDKHKLYDFVERERTVGNEIEVYNVKDPVVAKIDNKLNRFVLTLGFRF